MSILYFNIFFTVFLSHQDCNFIAVDWEELANKWYFTAVKYIKDIGNSTAAFINSLHLQGLHFNKLHLIGFSLGAHIAGIAGSLVNGRISRITGFV